MAFIILKSSSKDLSFELNKNPAAGMQIQQLRKGHCFGWYSNRGKQYNMYFQDNAFTCSFNENLQDGVEYNDLERYINPEGYLQLLNKALAVKEGDCSGEVNSNSYSIVCNNIRLPKTKLMEALKRDLRERFEIKLEQPSKVLENLRVFNLEISTKSSTHVYELLQLTKLILVLQATDRFDTGANIDAGQVDKYVKVINKLDLNFHVRNLFKTNCLTPTLFKKYKDLLEESKRFRFEFQAGTNFELRKQFVLDSIDFNNTEVFVDLGAGEGKYVSQICKKFVDYKGKKAQYIAIEEADIPYEDLTHTIRKKQLGDIAIPVKSWKEYEGLNTTDKKTTILCTEVLEHNKLEAIPVILEDLKKVNYDRIVITTPNKDFNKNYNLEEGQVRDEDHRQEFSKEELLSLLYRHFNQEKVQLVEVGDKVNGECSTFGVVISQ